LEKSFDLFGLPLRDAAGKAGRPRKEATDEERNKIKLLLAIGWNVERMAPVVRMSQPTFRRVFFHELKEREFMRDRLYARRLELAALGAEAGNVAALKELGKMLADQDRFFAEEELKRLQAGKPNGKKEQAKAAAQAAAVDSGDWGDDLNFAGGPRAN
jgi:hypothetical protein